VTTTFLLPALVLHTQITKVAVLPGATCDEVASDCASSQSCGDEDGHGDMEGLGLGCLGPGLDVVLGCGLALGVALPDGDGVELSVGDGVELSVGGGE
jgi:hypothetical protein